MHSEVKKVLEVAKRKKRNERVVRLVDAAARGDVAEVACRPPLTPSPPLFPVCHRKDWRAALFALQSILVCLQTLSPLTVPDISEAVKHARS